MVSLGRCSNRAEEEKSSGNNIRSRYNIDSIEAAGLNDNFQTFKSTGYYPPKGYKMTLPQSTPSILMIFKD
jgi:hypothetical protein